MPMPSLCNGTCDEVNGPSSSTSDACQQHATQQKLQYSKDILTNNRFHKTYAKISHASLIIFLMASIFMILCDGMKVDPERIAARLRIEEEIVMDKLGKTGRNRRQLGGTPKEQTIQVTAPLFSARLFDYGPESGDKELSKTLDFGKKLQLTHPVHFYGKEYTSVQILSNGAIGLEPNTRTYRSKVLPSSLKLIAPFWNRNDLKVGGNVYYREITSGRILERGQSEIRYQYDHEVKVLSAVIATWESMQPLGNPDKILPEEVKFIVIKKLFSEYQHFPSRLVHHHKWHICQLYLQKYWMDPRCRSRFQRRR